MPILIYKEGREDCDVLNTFSEQFGRALAYAGKKVMIYDCHKDGAAGWQHTCMNKHFQAAIGMQSSVFGTKIHIGNQEQYLHEHLYGPKFNYIFDHPVMMHPYMEHEYKDFYLLSHDVDYAAFAECYM